MNENGHLASLKPFAPGNVAAVKHGVFSERSLAPEIERYRDELLALPHVAPVDTAAINEAAVLMARIAAIDRDLDERGHFGRNGARSLLDHRARLSRELRSWLMALGALPSARADWTTRLSGRGVNDEIRRRLAAVAVERDRR